MADAADYLQLEVAYTHPEMGCSIQVTVPPGATVRAAIERSRILERFSEIDLARNQIGIYGQPCAAGDLVQAGDRVEIYRPLRCDPKIARRQRASRERSAAPR